MLIRISFFAALGGFLFGYDLGLIGGALLGFSEDLGIHNTLTQETIVGALKLGAFFGTFLGGAMMLRYGRRPAIAATAITGVLGPILMATATNSFGLVAGRITSGLGIGASAIVVPAYLAELAPAAHRGAMVQVYEVMLCCGMLVSTIVDFGLQHVPHGWRWMVGLPAVPGAVIGLALLVLPESPRWLVMQGRLEEALNTLQVTMTGSTLGALLGLGRVQNSTHPESPDLQRPQLLTKACHVFQTLEPRLLDMCHGMVPGSDADGEETHIVATALLIHRDAAQPNVFIEVESYMLHEGRWMYHHKEHQMPSFGSFIIFYDKYGPGHHAAMGAVGAVGHDLSGRYRFDLVSPRRTPTLSRAPTPQVRRSTPAISRNPTPQPRRSGTPPPSRNPTPQARRTPALSRKPTPQPRRTPQPSRQLPSRARAAPTSHSDSPASVTVMSVDGTPNYQPTATDASTALAVPSQSSAALQQWLVDNWPEEKLVYMDDVEGEGGSGVGKAASQQAKQLAAQQQMMNMLLDPEAEKDTWLYKQSGFRYES